jgi:hypothetical protein
MDSAFERQLAGRLASLKPQIRQISQPHREDEERHHDHRK